MRALPAMSLKSGIAAAVAVLIAAMLLAGALLPLPDPDLVDIAGRFAPPSQAHPLGTDGLGRDGLSRLLAGAGWSIPAALLSVLIAIALGWPLGLAAGAFPWVGRLVAILAHGLFVAPSFLLRPLGSARILMALCCVFCALPAIWLALAAIVGWGLVGVAGSALIGLIFAPAVAFSLRHATGPKSALLRLAPLAPSLFAWALFTQGQWDGLGLGATPPAPSWGSQLLEIIVLAWPSLAAALCLLLTALAAFCLSDALSRRRPPALRAAALPPSSPPSQA